MNDTNPTENPHGYTISISISIYKGRIDRRYNLRHYAA